MQAKAFPAVFFYELRCKLGTIRPTLKSHTTRCSENTKRNVYDGRLDKELSNVISVSPEFSVRLWLIPLAST